MAIHFQVRSRLCISKPGENQLLKPHIACSNTQRGLHTIRSNVSSTHAGNWLQFPSVYTPVCSYVSLRQFSVTRSLGRCLFRATCPPGGVICPSWQLLWLTRQVEAGFIQMPAKELWVHACECLQRCRLELLSVSRLWDLTQAATEGTTSTSSLFMPASVYSLLLSGLRSCCRAAMCLYQRRAWTCCGSGGLRRSLKAFWSAWEGLNPAR